jgi:hypothetical protein
MQPNFFIAMGVMKFLGMISTTCNPTCFLPWGVQCMVNINIIIEGHSKNMHACEQIPKALKMDGIYQCFWWM